MVIRAWQAVALPAALAAFLVLWGLPGQSWLGTGGLSLAAAAAALTLMAGSALLGSRWAWVETALGGLDRVYAAHKWMGVWALVLASVHLLFKAGADGWEMAPILQLPGPWTRFVRQASYAALVGIVVLALNRNIPYATWRLWHKLSGPLFLVVVLHALSIKSPIALDSPAGLWLATWALLGAAGALYRLLLYPFLARHAEYEVVAVEPGAAAAHIQLAPTARPLQFTPGQFGFLRLKHEGLREPHPFTIASSSGGDGRVDFVVRALGDYTRTLVANVRPGMRADVYAPHGRFTRRAGAACEAWIAGGVGISPFIAWLKDPAREDFDGVTLFYFHTPGREFPAVDVLAGMAAARGARLVPLAGGAHDPGFAAGLEAMCQRHGASAVDVAFCGPQGLLQVVRATLAEHGVPPRNVRHELFEFR